MYKYKEPVLISQWDSYLGYMLCYLLIIQAFFTKVWL